MNRAKNVGILDVGQMQLVLEICVRDIINRMLLVLSLVVMSVVFLALIDVLLIHSMWPFVVELMREGT